MIAGEGGGRAGLESGNAKELVRPDDFVRGRVPLPAANRREPLRLHELGLFPAQRFFRLFACRDVRGDAQHAGGLPVRRIVGASLGGDPANRAILPADAEFLFVYRAVALGLIDRFQHPLPIVGMQPVAESIDRSDECVVGHPQDRVKIAETGITVRFEIPLPGEGLT